MRMPKKPPRYTADSFAMLTAAVTAGQLVYDDPQADVTMVKEAERVLQTAPRQSGSHSERRQYAE